jgi:hypothetical protein
MILYDEVIVETGTFRYSATDGFALQGSEPWSIENTKEKVLKDMEKIETQDEDAYITVFDGKTHEEKQKYKVEKKNRFIADYRTVDVVSQLESGSYGKEADFLKYALIQRKESYKEAINKNTQIDLTNKEFTETAMKTYGQMNLIGLLHNINDSLALSQLFKKPVSVDAIHTPLLRIKGKAELEFDSTVLDRLTQIAIPDFSMMELDDLIELRRHKAIESFRSMIWKTNSKMQLEGSSNVDDIFKKELLDAIKEMAPTKRKLMLDTALGTLSFIPQPLVSIGTTIASVGMSFKAYRDFATNWLSFMLKAKELDSS